MVEQAMSDEDGLSFDKKGQAEIEGRSDEAAEDAVPSAGQPPAGPHAQPEQTNLDATPGAGALPSPTADDDADAAAG